MTKKHTLGIIAAVVFILGMIFALGQCGTGSPNPNLAPGVVVGHVPAPSLLKRISFKSQYLGSPSIAILPDGAYLASHDIFGLGSSQDTAGITKVFRSTNKGKDWAQVATFEGQFWSTLFVHNGALYIFGYTRKGGDIVIRKSLDGGYTWTTPENSDNGLLKTGRYGGTPNRPVIHDDRFWIGQSTRVISAPVEADLLKAASWTLAKSVVQDKNWLGGTFPFWTEGQIAASPEQGVALLPKVNQLPYTAILRASLPGALSFDPYMDFAELPGAEKKFGAAYDPVSKKFYVCSNPVLPIHKNDWWLRKKPALIRNAAALLSSTDLHNWNVEKIFLYSPDLYHEAFQYLNFEFDGDDLAIISRTAFVIGGPKPPRGHDSNLMTFHRLPDFRNAKPEYQIEISPNAKQVLRFEQTQYQRAPLGAFPLGNHFDGAPLTEPAGLAQDQDGVIYIRERAGRILQFDAAGNFLQRCDAAPLPVEEPILSIKPPPAEEQSWIGQYSTAWEDPYNWFYWGRADTPSEIAVFGSAADNDTTITVNRLLRIKGFRFCNETSYTIAGSGEIILGTPQSEAILEATRGQHTLQIPISFGGNAHVNVDANAAIAFAEKTDLQGKTLEVKGAGKLTLMGTFTMGNGRLILTSGAPVEIDASQPHSLDGTLEVRLPEGVSIAEGLCVKLFDLSASLQTHFTRLELPSLPENLAWNTETLYNTGTISAIRKP